MSDTPQKKTILSFLSQEALSAALQSGLSLLAPIGIAALTIASGLWNNVPLWLLAPLAGLAFMTVIVTINALDQFFQRRDLRDKVKFSGFKFERSLEADTREEGYTVALFIENMSDVLVEYQARSFEAVLGDVRSREGALPSQKFKLAAKNTAAYKSGLIPGVRRNATFAVKVRCTVVYGRRSGALRHELHNHLTFVCETNADGDLLRGDLYSGDDIRDESLIKALRAAPPASS